MGTRQVLSTAIKNKLLLLTDFVDDKTVWESPNFNTQTPAVLIIPARVDPEFDTFMTNKRVYAFTVVMLDKLEGDSDMDAVYQTMRAMEDAVIDAFDLDPMFRDVDLSLPAGNAIIDTMATPSTWERVQDDDLGQFLVAEVEVRVYIDRDIE